MTPPTVHAPTAVAATLRLMTEFLESRVAAGATFQPGESIQFGWMWFRVGTSDRGEPAVRVPEFGSMPMRFIDDCSEALNLVLLQQYVCDSFAVAPSECSCMQSALVIADIDACHEPFIDRIDGEENRTSGWYFGAADSALDPNVEGNLKLRSLWELSCQFPVATQFLHLPPGWQVILKPKPQVLCNRAPAAPLVSSYVAKMYYR